MVGLSTLLMPGNPRTTAIIVTFNSLATIDRALEGVREAFDAGELRVIVVDNASSDGSAEHVRRIHPWVQVVDSPGNVGFGRGCNLGVRHATTPYVLLLNPDAVLDRAGLEVLVRFMDDHPDCGAVGPAIKYPDGTLQHAGGLITPLGLVREALSRRPGGGRRAIVPGGEPFPTDWLCGAVFMTRLSLYRRLGGMDSRFFLYFEETDLCRRILRSGNSLWAAGRCIARHDGGSSAQSAGDLMDNGCLPEHFYPSRFYFLSKHYGFVRAALAEALAFVITFVPAMVRGVLRRRPGPLSQRLKGGILRLPRPALLYEVEQVDL